MRFLGKNKKYKKISIVISDLHLSAGLYINGRKNVLEDFQSDIELSQFLKYYTKEESKVEEFELIINGDFLDFLAVPYIKVFDDEFWSERAGIEKLKLILEAHTEVFDALDELLQNKNSKLIYIIGNHDAEMVFESCQNLFIERFTEEVRSKITILKDTDTYRPVPGVYVKHGHQYEQAHNFDLNDTIIESNDGTKYLNPSWGAYYVSQVINKYKIEREYVNQVRPIKNFIIHGILFDTFFMLRFIIANAYYFIMVRVFKYIKSSNGFNNLIKDLVNELHLFQDFTQLTRQFFEENKNAKALLVGHTHEPTYRMFADNTVFINTGTWTKMTNIDFQNMYSGTKLTYAVIKAKETIFELKDFSDNIHLELNTWKGQESDPYEDFV
jgi:UDP-2,3-diacylglucosamine pyrophosphatase LpxH